MYSHPAVKPPTPEEENIADSKHVGLPLLLNRVVVISTDLFLHTSVFASYVYSMYCTPYLLIIFQ